MNTAVHEHVSWYIGFGPDDAERLRAAAPFVRGSLPAVADAFYRRLRQDAGAMALLRDGEPQIARLRETLQEWLETLFAGAYDDTYWQRRKRTGHTHVQVGLPQHYMFAAMDIIRQQLTHAIKQCGAPQPDQTIEAMHKLLAVETAVMLDSYKESYTERVKGLERFAMEEKLTRAEHLAEIGQLAASLAHEIKNPLAGISGAIQVISEAMGDDDPHRGVLQQIMTQIDRLDAVVKDLLVYARPSDARFGMCDLQATVQRVLAMVREFPDLQKVPIHHDTNGTVPQISADPAKIEQLVMNLLLNAAHACEDGGTVTIATNFQDGWAGIRISDTGHGMREAARQRAFEPFFTTKSKGTGLGLPICQSIVQAHNGTISLDSRPGHGTTVTVRLPRKLPRPAETKTA